MLGGGVGSSSSSSSSSNAHTITMSVALLTTSPPPSPPPPLPPIESILEDLEWLVLLPLPLPSKRRTSFGRGGEEGAGMHELLWWVA